MAFWSVPNRVTIVKGENGEEIYGDFQCDSESDLNDNIEGVPIAKGSTVQIIQASSPTFLTMDSEKNWYPELS